MFQQARNHLRIVEPGLEGGPQRCQRVCHWLQRGVRVHTDRFYPERAACFDRSVATFSSKTVGVTKQGAVQIGATREDQPGQYRSAVSTFDGCTDWCLDAPGERHHIGTVGIDLQGCPSQDVNRAVLDRGHRAVLDGDQRATLRATSLGWRPWMLPGNTIQGRSDSTRRAWMWPSAQ